MVFLSIKRQACFLRPSQCSGRKNFNQVLFRLRFGKEAVLEMCWKSPTHATHVLHNIPNITLVSIPPWHCSQASSLAFLYPTRPHTPGQKRNPKSFGIKTGSAPGSQRGCIQNRSWGTEPLMSSEFRLNWNEYWAVNFWVQMHIFIRTELVRRKYYKIPTGMPEYSAVSGFCCWVSGSTCEEIDRRKWWG